MHFFIFGILCFQATLNKTNEKVSVNCDHVVLTAGAWSGKLARLVGIGTGQGILSVELPIEHRYD